MISQSPFFSVVITVYNKAAFIRSTIASVLAQSFKDFEVIIINDGSTDESAEIINSFNDNRLRLISTKNQGASKARNTGIEEAKYQYIALLDGDDIWHSDYLNAVYNAIIKFPDAYIFSVAIAQKYKHKTVPVNYSFKQKELYAIYNYFKASQKYTILTSSSIVFHKSVLDKTGYFDTTIVSGQDTDMWIRFGLFYEVVFINRELVLYNYNNESLSNTTFKLDKKPKFDKYFEEEDQDNLVKTFLDRNRYSMAILSKLQNDKDSFKFYKSHIKLNSLNNKQKVLINSPKWLIKLLLKIKSLKGEKLYYSTN
ncbi:glycosyltransferase family 2 protein [Winogradskyella sp. PE311]|uniref:glycosyltransferase family 2 protein n=1 Tax=Winogradskyella sp. PE311 TaxID=3366943 RepID=UPI0039813683